MKEIQSFKTLAFLLGQKLQKIVLLLSCCIVVSGCSYFKNVRKHNEYAYSQEELYSQGVNLVLNKKYKSAAAHFFRMYTEQPGNSLAAKAMLLEAYCSYKNQNYLDSLCTLQDLETFHPKGCQLDYVYYLKMLCYEKQIRNVEGCSGVAHTALKLGYLVAELFPESIYTKKILKFHVPFIQNYLTEKEMYVGRLHLNNCNPVGAILSFQNVLKTDHANYFRPEALFRMIEGYLMMDLHTEALECQKLLQEQFSENFWHDAAKKRMLDIAPTTKCKNAKVKKIK